MEIGSTVTLTYVGTLDDGTQFGFADEANPMKFQTGMDMVVDGFEEAILEMSEVGEEKEFTIDEYKAYGEYLDDFVQKIPMEQIPITNIKPGKRLNLINSDDGTPMQATVMAVEDGIAVIDMNHPLAGKHLTYKVKILDIEEPPENFVSAKEKADHMKEQAKLLGGDQGDDYR